MNRVVHSVGFCDWNPVLEVAAEVVIGEEPGEDGQYPNTRENLTKTVYKKITENCGVDYLAVGEFWHLENIAISAA